MGNSDVTKICSGFLVIFLFTAMTARGQNEVSVKAILDEAEINPGVTTVLQIKIRGGEPTEIPQEIEVPGLEVLSSGQNRSNLLNSSGVGGYEVNAFYAVSGKKEGVYTIPSVSFEVRGKIYKTEPISIRIRKMSGDVPTITSDRSQMLISRRRRKRRM